MIDQKQPENVEYLNYFGRMMTNNEGYLQEIKSRVAMEITAFKKNTLDSGHTGLKFKEEANEVLHLEYSLYGDTT
jgi:hypothetical protein